MQYSPAMLGSDPHALAVAALAALGSDLVEMRGRSSKLFTDTDPGGARVSRGRSKSSVKSRSSASSRSTTRTSRTVSSCSSTKSLSKASRSKKSKNKVKSTASKASSSKVSSVGTKASRRRTVVTVAPHPKPEKYVPPPRGTFRSCHTRRLRSEVIGALVSEIEGLKMPESVSLIADPPVEPGMQESSALSAPDQQIAKRPPLLTLTRPTPRIRLEDLPTLALAEFEFFSASRVRASDVKRTSWTRSPAAPAPPKVRRWMKNARKQPIGTLEEVDEDVKSDNSSGGKGEKT